MKTILLLFCSTLVTFAQIVISTPTVDKVSHTSARLQWTTDIANGSAYIKFDTADPPVQWRSHTKGYPASTIHGETLPALTPGTTYYAQVCHTITGTDYCSASASFITLPIGTYIVFPTLPTELTMPTLPEAWLAQYDIDPTSYCRSAANGPTTWSLQNALNSAAAQNGSGDIAIWIPAGTECRNPNLVAYTPKPRTNGHTGYIWTLSSALRDNPLLLPPPGVTVTKEWPIGGFATIAVETTNQHAIYPASGASKYMFAGIRFTAKKAAVNVTAKVITAVFNETPIRVTATGHGLTVDGSNKAVLAHVEGTGITGVDGTNKLVTVVDPNTFTFDGTTAAGTFSGSADYWQLANTYGDLVMLPDGTNQDFWFDRCIFTSDDPKAGILVGLRFKNARSGVMNSLFNGFNVQHSVHLYRQAVGNQSAKDSSSSISQALDLTSCQICKIENNNIYIDGITIFGPEAPTTPTSDIVIRGNRIEWPIEHFPRADNPQWDGFYYISRQFIEFKTVKRCLIEGNIFTRYWNTGDVGNSAQFILFSARVSTGVVQNSESAITDVTVKNNVFRSGAGGISFLPMELNNVANDIEGGKRYLISNNLFYDIDGTKYRRDYGAYQGPSRGQILFLHHGFEGVTFERNTIDNPRGANPELITFAGDRGYDLRLKNNLFLGVNLTTPANNSYGLYAGVVPTISSTGTPIQKLADMTKNVYELTNNIFVPAVAAYGDSYDAVGITPTVCTAWGLGTCFGLDSDTVNQRFTKALLTSRNSQLGAKGFMPRYDSPFISGGNSPSTDHYDLGVNMSTLVSAIGEINNILITGITTSGATIRYYAPDTSACTVEYGTTATYGTGARISDGGSTRERAVTLSLLSSNTIYHTRILCAKQQTATQFRTLP